MDECKSVNSVSLVGKLLLRKPYNLDAMKVSFTKAWQFPNEIDIQEIFEHVFFFRFASALKRGIIFKEHIWWNGSQDVV